MTTLMFLIQMARGNDGVSHIGFGHVTGSSIANALNLLRTRWQEDEAKAARRLDLPIHEGDKMESLEQIRAAVQAGRYVDLACVLPVEDESKKDEEINAFRNAILRASK